MEEPGVLLGHRTNVMVLGLPFNSRTVSDLLYRERGETYSES